MGYRGVLTHLDICKVASYTLRREIGLVPNRRFFSNWGFFMLAFKSCFDIFGLVKCNSAKKNPILFRKQLAFSLFRNAF